MSTTSLGPIGQLKPIWTPADSRKAAEDAAKHKPVRLRDWIWAPALILFGILLPGLTAPEARADVDSDAYVMALDAQGITYSSEANAIAAGRSLCTILDDGATIAATTSMVQRNSGLDRFNSGYVVGAAIAAFCPYILTTGTV